ncbi:MAG: glucose-6-phosphate dehydrogenase assembly protein OpcA [Micromonosporaceae bacterium]|nr:glucose-6-phosphate dehydrogenase assembly protein OpcA [Micromonosporaceae bacterium]
MIGLWDTTGDAVVKALSQERRSAGGVATGLALTLVVVADEPQVRAAEAAATIAAAAHPCRLLIVMRSDETHPRSRLDAEVIVGGRLGPCEAAVMRLLGPLAAHPESVVMPLLAPDVPVVTWWQGDPPERIATDPLGIVAERRITDSARAADPIGTLRARAADYVPGDTDLAWTRLTPWRALLAGVFDTSVATPRQALVTAPSDDASAALLCGWLSARLGIECQVTPGESDHLTAVTLLLAEGGRLSVTASGGHATLASSGCPDQLLPLTARPLGEELAEELRRLGPDQVYAEALAAATGITSLPPRGGSRMRTWQEAG